MITNVDVPSTSSTPKGVTTALSQFSSLSVAEVASDNGTVCMYVLLKDNVHIWIFLL